MLRKVGALGAVSDGGVPRSPHWQDHFLKMCHITKQQKGGRSGHPCTFFPQEIPKMAEDFFFNLKGTLFRPTVGSPGRLSPQRHSWRRTLLHRNSHSLQKGCRESGRWPSCGGSTGVTVMVGRLLKDTAAAMLAALSRVAACLGGPSALGM